MEQQSPLKYCAWLYFYFLDTGNTQYIQLNENVNGEILQRAVDEAVKVHPWVNFALDINGSEIKYKDAGKSLFPLKIQPETKVGVIFANPARLVMSDAINLYDNLSIEATIRRRVGHQNVKETFMPWRPTLMERVSVGDIAMITDLLIFTTVNAYAFEEQVEALKYIRSFLPKGKKTIVGVATRGPSDAKILAEYCDAVIVTGGLTQVTLDALVDALFKDGEFDKNPAKKI